MSSLWTDLKRGLDFEAHKKDPALWVSDHGLLLDKSGRPARLDSVQQDILRSNQKRIIVNCHRQWGKAQSAAFYACTPLSFALGHCRC